MLAEVARTRLREGNPRYQKFWQTIFLVYREEGRRGLYRGMVTQLCRQIPNTAIMMVTYEFVVYGLSRKVNEITCHSKFAKSLCYSVIHVSQVWTFCRVDFDLGCSTILLRQ